MSRLGKLPIAIPKGTTVLLTADLLSVKGPKGTLTQLIPAEVKLAITDEQISVTVMDADDKKQRALWGLMRSLIRNMVEGVNKGFEKKLEINGVGYKMASAGDKVNLSLGFSHPVVFNLPKGITAVVEGKFITIAGFDKQLVGETAASIRRLKEPEPYKGKGIKYVDEVIRRKAGKTSAK
jgi:large subunit ribosomal protein L6